jgi:hypothetical protein
MIPDELERFVNNNSTQTHTQKYFKHVLDSLISRFIDNVLFGPLVDKIQYLLSRNHSICMADPPFILLQVTFPLHITHYCHIRFGYYQVWCSLEIEHLKYFVSGLTVIDSHEECGIDLCIDCALEFV